MQREIEAKFLSINHDDIRNRLTEIGAVCSSPMRLMRRVTFDSQAMKNKGGWIRVRDEGDKTTLTYKQVSSLTVNGVHEIEVVVADFDKTVELFQAMELDGGSFQESKRETWTIDNVEIMLDEWPWLDPYIEIEGPDESAIRAVAHKLSLDWENAKFGDVMVAYRAQYPHLLLSDTVGNLPEVRFNAPLPELLKGQD